MHRWAKGERHVNGPCPALPGKPKLAAKPFRVTRTIIGMQPCTFHICEPAAAALVAHYIL